MGTATDTLAVIHTYRQKWPFVPSPRRIFLERDETSATIQPSFNRKKRHGSAPSVLGYPRPAANCHQLHFLSLTLLLVLRQVDRDKPRRVDPLSVTQSSETTGPELPLVVDSVSTLEVLPVASFITVFECLPPPSLFWSFDNFLLVTYNPARVRRSGTQTALYANPYRSTVG